MQWLPHEFHRFSGGHPSVTDSREHSVHSDPLIAPGLSRRSLLIGAGVAATVATFGVEVASAPAARAATTGLFWPTVSTAVVAGGEYGADRGPNHTPRYHQGYDVSIGSGTTIYGCGDGQVTRVVQDSSGYGRFVEVLYGSTSVITAHMSSAAVAAGDTVSISTVLGRSGGVAGSDGAGDSTGPHCHVEVRVGGALTDPTTVLVDRSLIGSVPTDPAGDEDMVRLIQVKNSSTGVGDYVVVDHGAHTYWNVKNQSMLTYLRNQHIIEVSGLQSPAIIDGYTKITY